MPRGQPALLSFAQERLWFLEQLDPGTATYNICRAARLTGPLNLAALEASVNHLIQRHEALRTTFSTCGDTPIQVVAPEAKLRLEILPPDKGATESELRRFASEYARRPFKLDEAPMLRAAVVSHSEEEHVLLLATHHIVSDAWSMGILTHELWNLYRAYACNQPMSLPDLPVQYVDYAVWQRDWRQRAALDAQLAYWKKQLGGSLPVLNLPTDHPRPPRQTFRGARVPVEFSETLTEALNALSRREGVTVFMTLLAAFNVLLYRYTGEEDVLVGSPIANRNRPEIEGLIGFFVNTLVLRTDLSGNPSFGELLRRVRDTCFAAYSHQDLPFERLVDELQPERDLSRNPLFQVMFLLQNAPRYVPTIPGITLERMNIETGVSKFDLTCGLAERDGQLRGFIEYNTDLFDRGMIERMAGHFQTLLQGIVADPDQPISTLPLLTKPERHQILVEWNDTAADYPKDSCIHELFEVQVEKTPDAVAVEFEEQQLTYCELNRRANQLAHYLRQLGVGPEKLVGICVERSLDMVVGLLGILKAGGAYVPLDPSYPMERLRFMLADANCSVLLTQQEIIEDRKWKMEDRGGPFSNIDPQTRVVCLDGDWALIGQQSEQNPPHAATSTNLAYVIYTSGSAGRPKGVLVPHTAVCNHVHWAQSVFRLGSHDRVLQKSSSSFDASVWELFAPLITGARLIVARPGGERDSSYLAKLITEKDITALKVVPSLLRMLLQEQIGSCTNLRHVLCGGEVLTVDLQKRFYDCSSATLHNLYGPTEATVDVTLWTCPREQIHQSIPIGRPIANTQVYVLDGFLQTVPVGIWGELHIAGASLARGYLNRPEQTNENFIPNPFLEESKTRIYKTGDIVRFLNDGNLEFRGRADNQINIRGYRIELGEIEEALTEHVAVRESVVAVFDHVAEPMLRVDNENSQNHDQRSDSQLVGYIVPKDGHVPVLTDLRIFLKRRLPDHMIPSAFVMIEALPLTPNGKVDRKKLSPCNKKDWGITEAPVAPRDEIEQLIAEIWKDVLGIRDIGVHDDFFRLGGHSLVAVQICSRMRRAFNCEVPVGILFESPTIADLAGKIEDLTREGHGPRLPPIVPVPRNRPLRLSMNQEHLWYLDRMIPGTSFFNIPYVYRLTGVLNTRALEKAIEEIIRRHESLRTVFADVNGFPVQVIKNAGAFQLTVVDLRGPDVEEISQQAAALLLAEREQPFDLAAGPLIREKLLQIGITEYLLLITMHHVISDRWSMQIFYKELTHLYGAFCQGLPSPLPNLRVQFADYAQWQRTLLDGGLLNDQLVYWKTQLGRAVPLIGSGKHGKLHGDVTSDRSWQLMKSDPSLTATIKSLAISGNCTSFMIVVAGLSIALHLYTGDRDIRIATLTANRHQNGIDNVIGHCLNTVILSIRLAPHMTCQEILTHVRKIALAATANQDLPFEHLASTFEKEHQLHRLSLFQVLVNYAVYDPKPAQIAGLTFASVDVRRQIQDTMVTLTGCDLVFDVRQSSTELSCSVNYNTECYRSEAIAMILRMFPEVLAMMVSDPDMSLSMVCSRLADSA